MKMGLVCNGILAARLRVPPTLPGLRDAVGPRRFDRAEQAGRPRLSQPRLASRA